MKVQLINYTGFGHSDGMFAAKLLIYAKSTRLEQNEETWANINSMSLAGMMKELDYISKTIRSSWEFVDYTFQVSGVSRACVDQMTRSRHASFAVQAQRVTDMSEFKYVMPDIIQKDHNNRFSFNTLMQEIASYYQYFKERGIPNQDCRSVLPMAAESSVLAKYNLRAFADIVGKRENLRAQGEYAAVAAEMKRLVLDIHPWTSEFISPQRKQTPNLDAILRERLGSKGPLDDPQLNAALKEVDALKEIWG